MGLISLLLILLLIVSCATNPVTRKTELMLISTAKEKQLGEEGELKISKESLEEGPFIKNGWPVEYLQRIVNGFMPFYERSGTMPVSVAISTSAVPNAWSVPGYITVHIGIIPCFDNEAQLAFVLGHELGHIAARHVAERYTQSTILSLGTSLLGAYAGRLPELLGNVAASLYIASYSRGQERLADKQGLKYMALSGYDPAETYKAMEKIETCSKRYMNYMGIKEPKGFAGFISRILRDHPGTEERIRDLKLWATDYKRTFVTNRYDFGRIKRWAETRDKVLIKLEKAVYLASKDKYDEADELIQQATKEMDKDFEPEVKAKIYALAAYAYMKLEDYTTAVNYAYKAMELVPDFYVSYKIAGVSGLKSGSNYDLKRALKAFEMCLVRKYNDPDYRRILRRKPIDPTCFKGAMVASCRLRNEKKCRRYCKLYYKKNGPTRLFVRYCL